MNLTKYSKTTPKRFGILERKAENYSLSLFIGVFVSDRVRSLFDSSKPTVPEHKLIRRTQTTVFQYQLKFLCPHPFGRRKILSLGDRCPDHRMQITPDSAGLRTQLRFLVLFWQSIVCNRDACAN
jgi:hypothetical protein